MSGYPKDPERVAAGLKGAIHNPNVSEQAKEHAAERLEEMEGGHVESNRSLGGYKATLHNEHTSEQAKAHAREVLEAAGYHVERPETSTEEEHNIHVLAGYKAALSNPNVSEEAKQHAMAYLETHGAL